MSRRKRFKVRTQQRHRRRKRLERLRKGSAKIEDFFCAGRYIGKRAAK